MDRCSRIWFTLILIGCISTAGTIHAAVEGTLPGKIELFLYESGTGSEQSGNSVLYASLGDTISIDVFLRNLEQVRVSGISIYLTVNDTYFSIVPQGRNYNKSIRPFKQGDFMEPAQGFVFEPVGNYMHGDSLSAMDNGIEGWQLDYVEQSGADVGSGRPTSNRRWGVACSFQLVCKAPVVNQTISLDDDRFNLRYARYNVPTSADTYLFRPFTSCSITVTGVEINPPLPDILMAPNTTNSSIDLDDYVGISSIPDSQLLWTASGNNRIGVSIDPSTHVVTFTAPSTFQGYEDIKFSVGEGTVYNTSDIMRVTVDDPPKLLSNVIPEKITIYEDSLEVVLNLRNAVQDSDDAFENLLWTITTGSNITYSVIADSLALKGKQDYFGMDSLKLVVRDSYGLGDSTTVQVEVLPVNDAPRFAPLPDISFFRGESFTVDIGAYAKDVDGDPLSLVWKQPENLFISVNGLKVTFSSETFIGSEQFDFTVSDPFGLSASDTTMVTVKPAHKSPVWTRISKMGFPQGHADSTIFIWDFVADPDDPDENLSFVFTGRDDIDSIFVNKITGRLTMYDLNNTPGWDRIMVTAFDPDGNSASTNFLAFVGPADGTPIVGGIPDTTIVAATQVEWIDLDDFYYDVDNTDTQMRWTWGRQVSADSVVTISIHPISHRVTLTGLGADKFGFDRLFFTVTDPSEKFADDICIVTVVKDLSKPTLALPFKVGFIAGEKTTLDLDDYVEELLYTKSDLAWTWALNQKTIITLDTPDAINSRPVSFSGAPDWIGWEYVSFKVTNPLGGAAQDTVLVFSVSADGSPLAGGLRPFALKAGECTTVNLENYSFDADTPDYDLSWAVSGNDSITISINQTTHVATVCAPSYTWEGQENITFTVTDKENHTSSMTALVTVSGAVVRNAFSVLIFRNPMQEDYMDFYISSKEAMAELPSVRVKTGQDSTKVTLETISDNYYYGKYILPLEKSIGKKGTADILISATTKTGKAVQDTTRFAYGRVDAGGAKIALGLVGLTIPPGALSKPALITVAPAAVASTEENEQSSGEIIFSGTPLAIGPSSLSSEKPLTIEFPAPVKAVGPGIYERSGDRWHFIGASRTGEYVSAEMYSGGTVRLGYDATPPHLKLVSVDDAGVRFEVADSGSGVDGESIVVRLDGSECTFSYEPKTSIVTIDRDEISGDGALVFEVTVSDRTGNRKTARIGAELHALPDIIALEQNHPNPFNPVTHITFENTTEQVVSLEVYDLLGRKVRVIVNDRFPAGRHTCIWDARDDGGRMVSSGTYLYRVVSNTGTITKKMLLLR